jgi:hypothetical protein
MEVNNDLSAIWDKFRGQVNVHHDLSHSAPRHVAESEEVSVAKSWQSGGNPQKEN